MRIITLYIVLVCGGLYLGHCFLEPVRAQARLRADLAKQGIQLKDNNAGFDVVDWDKFNASIALKEQALAAAD